MRFKTNIVLFPWLAAAVAAWSSQAIFAADDPGPALRIPAATAYIDPQPEGARVSRDGISGWNDPGLKVLWFGQAKHPGALRTQVEVSAPDQKELSFRLTVAGSSRDVKITGKGPAETVTADFGPFDVVRTGYQRFTLESLDPAGAAGARIKALLLQGGAARDAHFNLKERRNAASVHLFYPTSATNVQWFYSEVTAVEDPVYTFYMACGFHRGYFGMQVNSAAERRIIFSVWDSGNEAVDRKKVAAQDRVTLIAKGEGVYAGDFGNEGTGGHSHLKYLWKTGEAQKFLLGALPVDETHTIYAGYYFHPGKKEWMLISAMKAPRDGSYLRGLHGFSENFGGSNGHLQRKALYGNQWIRTREGQWLELDVAGFSHDPTGRADRLDRFMGVENGQFFLSHGGFVEGWTEYRKTFTRPKSAGPPAFNLPEIPRG